MIFNSEPLEYKITYPHNHPVEYNEKIALDFMHQLKLVCRSGVNMSVKEIYEDVARMYVFLFVFVIVIIVCCSYPEGAKLKSFNMLRTTLYEWKRQ